MVSFLHFLILTCLNLSRYHFVQLWSDVIFLILLAGVSRDLPPRFQRMAQQQNQQTQVGPVTNGIHNMSGSVGSAPLGAPNQPSPSSSPPLTITPPVVNGIKEEVSLRPVKNFTMFKPNTPSMLPRSAQAQNPAPRETGFAAKKSTDISEMLNPLLDKQVFKNCIAQVKKLFNNCIGLELYLYHIFFSATTAESTICNQANKR